MFLVPQVSSEFWN